MPWSYASLDDYKDRLAIVTSPTDAIIRMGLEDAARQIDEWCWRTFRTYLATRYYTASRGGYLDVDDLLAITTLKHDDDSDRVYETTWAATDYDLLPFNAAIDEQPYTRLAIAPNGVYSFYTGQKGIEIAGRWGYWQNLLAIGTLGAAMTDTTGTSVTMASGHGLKALQTILIDTEQLYITAVATNTLTVERGVNGTTAATHLNAAAVSKYRYHTSVVEAAILQAARGLGRAASPFGVVGTSEFGTTFVRAKLDPDVITHLAPLRRIQVG